MNIEIRPFMLDEKYRTSIETLLFQLSGKQRVANLENYPGAHFIGVFDGESLIGFAQIFVIHKCAFTYGLLEDVIVHESHRGRGLGKRLLSETVAFAKEKGAKHINLTVRPERADARGLYQSLGFVRQETNVFRLPLEDDLSA